MLVFDNLYGQPLNCICYISPTKLGYEIQHRGFNDYYNQEVTEGDWLYYPSESLMMVPKEVGDWDC